MRDWLDLDPALRDALDTGALNHVCVECGHIEPAAFTCTRCGADSDPDTWHWRGDLPQ